MLHPLVITLPGLSVLWVLMFPFPYGSARHFNSKRYHDTNPCQYLKVQLIEQVHCNNLENIEDILWDREKYWQSQLFTIAKGMNGILDLYSSKRKGSRKR